MKELTAQAPAWRRFRLGAITATVATDGPMRPDGAQAQFPEAPGDEILRLLGEQGLPTDVLLMEQNCLVLEIEDQRILFDTGVGGDRQFGSETSGGLLKSLAAAGIAPESFTKVALTHAHCDHCWGLIDTSGAALYPNADIYIDQTDYAFWTDAGRAAEPGFAGAFARGAIRAFAPYQNRLNFVQPDQEIAPGVLPIPTPGHSVGHTSYLVQSQGLSFLVLGDVAHSSALLFPNPDWGFSYDFDPRRASQTRREVFDRAVREGIFLFGYHFAFPGVGKIERQADGYRYEAFDPEKFDQIAG